MEIGQPDFPAPRPVLEAALCAMQEQALGYTPALGIPELREAIGRHDSLYYTQDSPEVSDAEYDELRRELVALEERR